MVDTLTSGLRFTTLKSTKLAGITGFRKSWFIKPVALEFEVVSGFAEDSVVNRFIKSYIANQ